MSDQREGERSDAAGYTAPSPADRPTIPEATPATPANPAADAATPGTRTEPGTQPATPRPGGLRPGRPSGSGNAGPGHTRISGTWVGLILGAVVLIFLLVFVLQNPAPTRVVFLGWQATLPLGFWLLFAAIAGLLLLAIPGFGRMMQWRRASSRDATGRTRR